MNAPDYLSLLRQENHQRSLQGGTAQTAKTTLRSLCSSPPAQKYKFVTSDPDLAARPVQPSRSLLNGVPDPSNLISDYIERIAICHEAGDVTEDAAHRIASEQCGATLDVLATRQVNYWRQRIAPLREPMDGKLSNVRCIALDCLTLPWAYQAATMGWTAPELFGLHQIAANVRVEAMGLVSSLALSELRPPLQVVDISSRAATVATGNGAVLTHFRLRPSLGPPVWDHPAFEMSMRV